VPVAGVPGDPGFGVVRQGYLESSNVDPVKEITALISAQRGYEMNSKVMKAADEMANTVTNGIR
jgi:flagellar basal-body rod protein FlgG